MRSEASLKRMRETGQKPWTTTSENHFRWPRTLAYGLNGESLPVAAKANFRSSLMFTFCLYGDLLPVTSKTSWLFEIVYDFCKISGILEVYIGRYISLYTCTITRAHKHKHIHLYIRYIWYAIYLYFKMHMPVICLIFPVWLNAWKITVWFDPNIFCCMW